MAGNSEIDRPTGFESGEIIVFGNEMSVHDLQIFASNETHMSNVHPLYMVLVLVNNYVILNI